jgi:hypothetical protein
MKPEQMRENLAKLMNYAIADKSGFSSASRHAVGENVQRMNDTIDAVKSGMDAGQIPAQTGLAYIERLQKTLGRIDLAKEMARTDPVKSPWLRDLGRTEPMTPTESGKAISIALNNRTAGNINARLAKERLASGATDYPYGGSSMTEAIVLPPRIDDPAELAKFLANWKTYGQAAPQGR